VFVVFNEISLFTGFFFTCKWLKLLSINLARIENGTQKSKNTGNLRISGLYPFVLGLNRAVFYSSSIYTYKALTTYI